MGHDHTRRGEAALREAILAGGAPHEDVLARVRQRVTTGFKISHVTVQLEREGCAADKTHL